MSPLTDTTPAPKLPNPHLVVAAVLAAIFGALLTAVTIFSGGMAGIAVGAFPAISPIMPGAMATACLRAIFFG